MGKGIIRGKIKEMKEKAKTVKIGEKIKTKVESMKKKAKKKMYS